MKTMGVLNRERYIKLSAVIGILLLCVLIILIIENVPVVTCTKCGESYITAKNMQELERLKIHRKSLSKKQSLTEAIHVFLLRVYLAR